MAFPGTGHRLGSSVDDDPAATPRQVPSLLDCCLRVLERHIDMIDDIGVTPFHLIESVLRKCNELWYFHAVGEFKSIRDEYPQYDHSGEWRAIYEQRRKEEDEKFARVGAKLRQLYSQHDKDRQHRQVFFDPNLRLPKRGFRTGAQLSSGWGAAAPKKPKSLFEKAKLEARRTIQMFTPFPRNRSVQSRHGNVSSSSSSITGPTGRIRPPSAQFTTLRYPTTTASSTTASTIPSSSTSINSRIHPPVASSSSSLNTSGTAPRARTKYSYKTRPVVYTSLPGSATTSSHSTSNISESKSPATTARPNSTPLAPSIPIPANANGAIANFFKELNPSSVVTKTPAIGSRSPSPSPTTTSRRHAATTGGTGGRETRSPTSPVQPASKTMEALRPRRDDEDRRERHRREQMAQQQHERSVKERTSRSSTGRTLKDLATSSKKDDDYRWLEEDDDDNDDDDKEAYYHHHDHDRPLPGRRRKSGHESDEEARQKKKRMMDVSSSHQPIGKPMSTVAAGRQFFDQLLGK
ncbi:Elongin-A [Actinomortierella wolfii]|nr:Elongin-A [Actinomortierella wolfii]